MNPDDGLIPCGPDEAVQRMLALEASGKGCYSWGAGHYDPAHPELLGMTLGKNQALGLGWDCAGAAICYAFMLKRERPGFNRQAWATITDDLNVDSVLEDADPDRGGRGELGELAFVPQPGILLITPTIKIPEKDFDEPGHVRFILDASKWNPLRPRWADVVYLECRGGNGRRPGVVRDTGESVDEHDAKWPVDFKTAGGMLVRPRAAMVRIRAA
jgi:hypothetical protein